MNTTGNSEVQDLTVTYRPNPSRHFRVSFVRSSTELKGVLAYVAKAKQENPQKDYRVVVSGVCVFDTRYNPIS